MSEDVSGTGTVICPNCGTPNEVPLTEREAICRKCRKVMRMHEDGWIVTEEEYLVED